MSESTAHFNRLSPAEAERLALLMEELAETQQVIGKILRHGYESHHPDEPRTTNRSLLEKELGDALFALGLMIDCGDISSMKIATRRAEKELKIYKYLHHNGAA